MAGQVNLVLTNQDVIAAQRLYQRRMNWTRRSLVMAAIMLVVAPPLVAWLFTGGMAWDVVAVIGGGALGGVILALTIWPSIVGWIYGRRAVERQPSLRRSFTMSWDDAGYHSSDDVDGVTHYRWDEIVDLAHDRHGILLFLSPRLFLVLPHRVLPEGAAADLLETAARHGVPIWPRGTAAS